MLKPYIFQTSCWGTVAIKMLRVAKLFKQLFYCKGIRNLKIQIFIGILGCVNTQLPGKQQTVDTLLHPTRLEFATFGSIKQRSLLVIRANRQVLMWLTI